MAFAALTARARGWGMLRMMSVERIIAAAIPKMAVARLC
jgi:hypothetical protein